MNTQFDQYQTKLREHRRSLHKIPELNRHLPKTREYILSVLENLHCTLTFLCDSGVCAFFDKGARDTYAFRSDMDALPVQEDNQCEYASTHEGQMHACGHDGHMSMLLTFAEYVDTLQTAPHNVLLIFQPAEEMLGGAEEICDSGILARYNTVAVFGIHLWPFLPEGKLSSKPGAFMPRSSEINIDIKGLAAHGTAPYKGNDALFIAADFINRLYTRHANIPGAIPRFKEGVGSLPKPPAAAPEQKTLIHIGKMVSGYARNIVSDSTHLLGTIRGYDDEHFSMITDLIQSTLNEVGEEYSCETAFDYTEGYPPVTNNLTLYTKIRPYLDNLELGYEEMEDPLVISEDFSFYGLHAPAVFFVLGTGTGIPLHSTNFDFDEKILQGGFNLYKELLFV